jgi:hypothetical protein
MIGEKASARAAHGAMDIRARASIMARMDALGRNRRKAQQFKVGVVSWEK